MYPQVINVDSVKWCHLLIQTYYFDHFFANACTLININRHIRNQQRLLRITSEKYSWHVCPPWFIFFWLSINLPSKINTKIIISYYLKFRSQRCCVQMYACANIFCLISSFVLFLTLTKSACGLYSSDSMFWCCRGRWIRTFIIRFAGGFLGKMGTCGASSRSAFIAVRWGSLCKQPVLHY